MPRIRTLFAVLLALIPFGLAVTPAAAQTEKRIALVIGNSTYQAGGTLNTPANDAGLVAQTLQAAGFDVVGARDLDQDLLRHAFRDFVEKATGSGPDTVAFIYVGGYGLQLEGENYYVPVDAKIARDSDIPVEALRISDYTRPLTALKLKASIVVLDAARANSFAKSGQPLAGGLALVDPEPGLLVAFNAAPGTVAPEAQGPYGPYAQALAEMIREGGLPLTGVFDRTRLRVNDLTGGAEVPWHASKVQASLVFFERAADAPPPAVSVEETAAIRARPIRELGPQDAYTLCLERDTIEGYSEFIAAYPADPMVPRVRAIVAARREAITWRRTRVIDTPPAYWSYVRRYPEGPHSWDARRRLAFLAAELEPPPRFTVIAYDLPPPPPEEFVYIRRPVLVFDDPVFGFAPPPPAPVIFLAPPPPEFVVLAPPPPPIGLFVLPMPVYRPVPVWVRPPRYIAPPPPNNVIYNNVHNTVVVNNVTNTVTVTNQTGQTRVIQPPARTAQGGAPAGAALGPSLPPSVAHKAALQTQTPPGAGAPGAASPITKPGPGQPLPGMQGQPLPPAPGTKPGTPAAPSAAVAPNTTIPGTKPAPGAKPGTPPSAAVIPGAATPGTSSTTTAPPGGKPGTPGAGTKPTLSPPAAKLTPPASPPPIGSGAPSSTNVAPPALPKPATSSPPPALPAAKLTPPPAPPKPATPPPAPPPRAAAPPAPPPPRVAAPPPPPPPPRVAAPPPPPPAARPAAPACPPGKTAAVVNGQHVCK